jgi:peroxiredoxin
MAQLRREYEEYVAKDAEVIVVGPEPRKAFVAYWEKHDLPFVGLPDPKHTVLKLYGQEVKLLKLGRLPAQLIVDKAGTVRFAHYSHSMSDIPELRSFLSSL